MKVSLIIPLCSFLALTLIAADPEKPARRPAAAGATRTLRAGQAGAGAGGLLALERVLTDEQREALREHMKAGGKELREGQQELMKLRRELQEAVLSGKATASVIKEKTEAIAKLDAEQLGARMTALSKIAATLTDEQREKLKNTGEQLRPGRPAAGAGLRQGDAPATTEPAAPPPPDK
jgi:Spy/CpxP family protein refolding chaperone